MNIGSWPIRALNSLITSHYSKSKLLSIAPRLCKNRHLLAFLSPPIPSWKAGCLSVCWCDPKGHHFTLEVFLHWYQKMDNVPGIHFEQKNEAMNTWLMSGWEVIQFPQITPPKSGSLLWLTPGKKRECNLFRLTPKPNGAWATAMCVACVWCVGGWQLRGEWWKIELLVLFLAWLKTLCKSKWKRLEVELSRE